MTSGGTLVREKSIRGAKRADGERTSSTTSTTCTSSPSTSEGGRMRVWPDLRFTNQVLLSLGACVVFLEGGYGDHRAGGPDQWAPGRSLSADIHSCPSTTTTRLPSLESCLCRYSAWQSFLSRFWKQYISTYPVRISSRWSGFIKSPCKVAFLDEFRVVVSYPNDPSDAALVIFNTLVPQDHPNNVRRFMLPSKYLRRSAEVFLDHSRSLGAADRNDHLIADPNQAILAMTLSPGDRDILILRMQQLIEHACSTRTDIQIPWDEWGRDAVVMDNPTRIYSSIPFIHGARMLVIHKPIFVPQNHYQVHAFDFSRRGIAALPLSDGTEGGTERRAVFKDWQNCVFEVDDGPYRQGPIGIGDSIMFHIVSLLSHPTEEGVLG